MDSISFLIAVVATSLGVSAICSLSEAALYAVSLGFVRHQASNNNKSADILLKLKESIGKPIAAILILNTVANTAGAAIAGASAAAIWGPSCLFWFSLLFTMGVLLFSEIVPKQLGVSYSGPVALFIARPLRLLVKILSPIIYITEKISSGFMADVSSPKVSQEELVSLAELGNEEGVLDNFESSVIQNLIGLDIRTVKQAMTPRVVVNRLLQETTLEEVRETIHDWEHSRIPLIDKNNPDHVQSYVAQRDIFSALLKNKNSSSPLSDYSRPLKVVPEVLMLDKMFAQAVSEGEHIYAVINEHGAFSGILTLEDIFEEIVGAEIIDEYDKSANLRSYAKLLLNKLTDKKLV